MQLECVKIVILMIIIEKKDNKIKLINKLIMKENMIVIKLIIMILKKN